MSEQVVTFEHVALALHRMTDGWPTFAEALGGRYLDHGVAEGYSWLQFRFANGMVLETLHPESEAVAPGSDIHTPFLVHFLETRGPGVHHLTFGVADLDRAMADLEAVGASPGRISRADPAWQEALYSAKGPNGVVLQVVQRDPPHPPPAEPLEGLPELGYDHPVASLSRVVHAVADLDGAVEVFRDGLGGTPVSSGAAVNGNHWVEIGWDGPGRLRLLEARDPEIAAWVGPHSGRVRHLFFTFDDPATVPGAHQEAGGRWAVDPDDALGVRLVLASTVR